MAEDKEVKGNLEESNDKREYEPPKLEVLGTVEQLTSEGDFTQVPR